MTIYTYDQTENLTSITDTNGNLLSQSTAGKAVTYTYDAEGVRRNKVNSEETYLTQLEVFPILDCGGKMTPLKYRHIYV